MSAELKPSLLDPVEHARGGLQELLEILLCEDCDMELGATALLRTTRLPGRPPDGAPAAAPRLAEYKDEIRRNRDGTCALCKVPIATGDCPHVRVANGQVVMSEATWRAQVDELIARRRLEDERDEERT